MQSSTATAGQPFATQPLVLEEDAFGNLEKTDNTTVVTASSIAGAGPLEGTSQITVSDGVATFAGLADDKAGSLKLQFSSGSLAPAVTAKTIVNPAPASQLVVQTQPSSAATAGQIFAVQPVVDEEDPFGNLETGDNNTLVTASIKGGGSPLEGTTMPEFPAASRHSPTWPATRLKPSRSTSRPAACTGPRRLQSSFRRRRPSSW